MSEGALGKVYASGEHVVRQGEVGNCMYVVQAGRLEVLKEDHEGYVRVGVLEVGDVFGEMSVFEREVRSASVRASGEARVLTVDKKTFLRRIQEDPPLAFNLVKMMSHRIRVLTEELASMKAKTLLSGAEGEPEERRSGRERRCGRDRRSTTVQRAGAGGVRAS